MPDREDTRESLFYERARLAAKEHAEKCASAGVRWLTFDELVASKMTEIEIEAHYGQDIAINVGIARDPEDAYWWADWSKARPASEVVPHLVEAHRRREVKWPAKGIVELRIDYDILDHFRKDGGDWESRLNDTLRMAVFGQGVDSEA